MDAFDHEQFEREMAAILLQKQSLLMQLGKTILAWGQVEDMLSRWFIAITGLDWTLGRNIFYAGRSFSARIDIFAASIPRQLPPTLVTLYLKEVVKKSRQYATFRNLIAHSELFGLPHENSIKLREFALAEPNDVSRYGTENHLMLAESRFEILYSSLRHTNMMNAASTWTHPHFRPWLEKHLELVRRLPNEPHSMAADPIFPILVSPPEPSPA